jgi:hypothetical protein
MKLKISPELSLPRDLVTSTLVVYGVCEARGLAVFRLTKIKKDGT